MSVLLTSDVSFNPRTGEGHGSVAHTDVWGVAETLRLAADAATVVSKSSPATRAGWLAAIADSLVRHQDELAQLAEEETALGLPRLSGEIAGAARSARFYAGVAVDGMYLGASSETVNDTTTLSRWKVPVGPVAVFGASNFPFGFGVLGHDVASAIAAGCPVVVKAHPAHPRLSVRLASIAVDALSNAGAPDGTYGLVVGFEAGLQVIDAPEIRAVAFTGSQAGGMALYERASRRGVPVFAEMGTVNPVFVNSSAVTSAERVTAIARGFVGSFTQGAGQFCTKPGLLFAPAGCGMLEAVNGALADVGPAPLLTAGIAEHFATGVRELAAASSSRAHHVEPSLSGSWVSARVISVALGDLKPGSRLLDECFGPVALVCEYDDADAAARTLATLQGSLTASVFIGDDEDGGVSDSKAAEAGRMVEFLLAQVGRVSINAWPTGVTNSWSQQHGGPWPATSRSEATSVGAGALDRFVRPVALQNARPEMLPPALAPDNPWNVPRRIDGAIVLPSPTHDDTKVSP